MNVKNSILLLLCLVPILASCGKEEPIVGNREPALTEAQMQWKGHQRSIAATDPLYLSLEVVEDGYKMIRAYRPKALESKDQVEWGWRFTVKNKSQTDLPVTVKYQLLDKDSFELTTDTESRRIKAGETITIQNSSTMTYDDAQKVARSGWRLSSGEDRQNQAQVGGSKGRREEGMIRSVEIPTPQQEYGKQLAESREQQEEFWKQAEASRKLQEEQRQLLAESARQREEESKRQLSESQNPQGVALAQSQAEESKKQQEEYQRQLEESKAEAEKQRKAYWDSVEESKRQAEEAWKLQVEYRRQKEEAGRQLEKSAEQQKRFDQILTTWEEQQKQYQKYLDKLEQK